MTGFADACVGLGLAENNLPRMTATLYSGPTEVALGFGSAADLLHVLGCSGVSARLSSRATQIGRDPDKLMGDRATAQDECLDNQV